jgi:nitroreductase
MSTDDFLYRNETLRSIRDRHSIRQFADKSVDNDAVHDFFRIMEIQSSAAAVENMLLAATSLGLSSVWLGILIMIQKEVLNFLGNPNGEFMAVIPVGYATRSSTGPKKRSLNDVIRYE